VFLDEEDPIMTHWKNAGRSTVSTFIIVDRAQDVIDFAQKVFGAKLLRPALCYSDGSVWNAELDIGGSTLMLADLPDGMPKQAAILYVYVEDADATYKRALAAGAEEFMPVEDQFFGDRAGGVKDAQGNTWWIATHRRDMTDAEIEAAARIEEKRRAAE
jgi:uncharacterized glyoxalase superfamily protein PhnB